MLRLAFIFFLTCSLISCTKLSDNSVNPGQTDKNNTGNISFSVSIKKIQVQYNLSVDSVCVSLLGPTNINGKLTIKDSTASGTFSDLIQGNYTIFVAMFSGSDTIASGTGSAVILPGQLTTANISLSFMPGQLVINVTLLSGTGNLLAYYPFNGSATDGSENGNNGTVYGATLTSDRFGNPDSAYNFNGTSDYISFPVLFNTPPDKFSVSLFVRPTSYAAIETQNMIYYSGQGGEFELSISQTTLDFLVVLSNGIWYQVSYPMTISTWHHVAATYQQGNKIELFLDGTSVGTATLPNLTLRDPGSSLLPSIGSYARSKFFFQGQLDDVRIFNYVLSSFEIHHYDHENGW
jgi:hypothetical protein